MSNTLDLFLSQIGRLINEKDGNILAFGSSFDPLVLSVTLHRLRMTTPGMFNTANPPYTSNSALIPHIEDVDIQRAELIKEYYGKKILIWGLKGIRLTRFRIALANYLASSPGNVDHEFAGLIYKLPHFYDFDKTVDYFYDTHHRTPSPAQSFFGTLYLQPVDCVLRHASGIKSMVYLFNSSTKDGKVPVVLTLRHGLDRGNGSIDVFTSLFLDKQPLRLSGNYKWVDRWATTDYPAYELNDWTLLSKIGVKNAE